MTDGGPRRSSMYVAARTKSTQLRTPDRPRAAQCGERPRHMQAGAEVWRWLNEREEYA